MTIAEDLCPVTDIPAFPAACVDGFAVRGGGPWRVTGRILAGDSAAELGSDGTAAEIATGAMVPADADAIVRVEDSSVIAGLISGVPRHEREWRVPGEEASRSDVLVPAGTAVTPAVIGLAAASGRDELRVRPRPRVALIVSGDELLTCGPSGGGRTRDSLGPQLPAWLGRLGAAVRPTVGPVADTLDAHVAAIGQARDNDADLIVVTGGTMLGPADYLRAALSRLDADYAVSTVEVRPGRPMLLATVPGPAGRARLLAGLPGNPQAAVAALLTLAAPALLGLTGRPLPGLPMVRLSAPVPGRGPAARLALVGWDGDGCARPLADTGSAAMRGLVRAAGFAVIGPGQSASAGDRVPFLPLPILPGEHA